MKATKLPLALLTATLMMPAAFAEDYYVGANVARFGNTLENGQITQDLNANAGNNVQATIDKPDTGFEIYGGMKLSDGLSVEAAYIDLGNYDVTIRGTSTNTPAQVAQQAAGLAPTGGQGLRVGVKFNAPIYKSLRYTVRLGGAYVRSETDISSASGSTTVKDDKFGLTFGTGLELGLSKNLAVSFGWDFYRVDSESNIAGARLGLEYRF